MNLYQYRVTLQTGQIAIVNSGIQLDLLIKDRWEQVTAIELIPYGSCYTPDDEEMRCGEDEDEDRNR